MKQVDYDTGYALRDLRTGTLDCRTQINKEGKKYVVRLWAILLRTMTRKRLKLTLAAIIR